METHSLFSILYIRCRLLVLGTEKVLNNLYG